MKGPLKKLAPLAILLVTLLAYARSIPAPYMWDDISLIAQNPTLDDSSNIPRYFLEDLGHFNRDVREMGFYRPVQALSFHIETALFGRSAPLQRTVNILLHALAAIAVWLLAATLLRSKPLAFFAGALFALNPIATEQVCFIADRGGLLAAVFSLWTLVFLSRAVPETGPLKRGRLAAALACYCVALFSKDEALTMAAPAAAWFFLARRERLTDKTAWAACVLPLAAFALLFVTWRWGILHITHASRAAEAPGGLATRLLAIPRLTLWALKLVLVPAGLRPIRSIDYGAWTSISSVLFSTATWIVIFFLAWRARRKAPAAAFGIFFFAATMAPSSGVVALIRPVAEHYYYLPAAGVSIALAGLADRLLAARADGKRDYGRVVALGALLLCMVYFVGTSWRCETWRSENRLWADNAAKEPGNPAVLNNLGNLAAESGRLRDALAYFSASLGVDPGNIKTRVNRANAALSLGETNGVLDDIKAVLSANSCHEKALVQLGRLSVIDSSGGALAFALEWMKERPCVALVDVGAGLEWEKRGDREEAAAAYARFLSLAPDLPTAAMVRARLEALGRESSSPE